MGMNTLINLAECLENQTNKIELDADLCEKAMIPLQRMLDFSSTLAK
jgi:quinolinate synthase